MFAPSNSESAIDSGSDSPALHPGPVSSEEPPMQLTRIPRDMTKVKLCVKLVLELNNV